MFSFPTTFWNEIKPFIGERDFPNLPAVIRHVSEGSTANGVLLSP